VTEYRRLRVEGGCYFLTVALRDRRGRLLVERVEVLREAVRRVRTVRPFVVDAWVVLPEHMHMLWTLPEGDADFSTRVRLIKDGFTRGVGGGGWISASRAKRGEQGIWQRRFWEHAMRDERDYAACVDYIHFNPVRHGLVRGVAEWPYSTFLRCVRKGMYPADWVGDAGQVLEAGERLG
jgi:putative transposase